MVDALTSDDLRKLAASEHAWAESRMFAYREDGAPIPDPIRKCHGLADAVLKFLPPLGVALKGPEDSDVGEKLRHAREGIYALGMMIQTLNATLDGAALPAQSMAESALPVVQLPPIGPENTGATIVAMATVAPSAGDVIGKQWPAAGLYHGLVLVNAAGERRLFAEPIQGQYTVQNVASDGLTAGEPWSTMADKWPADVWFHDVNPRPSVAPALRRYDDVTGKAPKSKPPASDRTLALPGMGDVAPAAKPEVARKTIAGYEPAAVQFTTWTAAFSKAAGQPIKESRVREVFATWQAANASEEKPNPAAAFWHHAKGVLVDNATKEG